MFSKEYAVDENGSFDAHILESAHLGRDIYSAAHQGLSILCHDVLIWLDKGYVLVKRKNAPAFNLLWPIGGRIQRGMSLEESLKQKVSSECGLQIKDIEAIGVGRTFFRTAPFNHGRGTDTLNIMCVAEGMGKINLDTFHDEPLIVTPEKYVSLKRSLHPYVQDFLDAAYKIRNANLKK